VLAALLQFVSAGEGVAGWLAGAPPHVLALLRTAHVLAAVLFVGNVIVTGVWAARLFAVRATHDFRVAARAIVVTDWWFTVAGGGVLVMSGVSLALARGYPLWGTPWIRQAIVALGASTLLWLVVLVPAQRRMSTTAPADDAALVRAYRRWNAIGWLATAPLVYALWCMVAKPAG
jgi:uncharacterized membrane protein